MHVIVVKMLPHNTRELVHVSMQVLLPGEPLSVYSAVQSPIPWYNIL